MSPIQEILDESDRLTQFIEDRAKDTLLRFARKRQERLSNGQINPRLASVIGNLGTPRRVSWQVSGQQPRADISVLGVFLCFVVYLW